MKTEITFRDEKAVVSLYPETDGERLILEAMAEREVVYMYAQRQSPDFYSGYRSDPALTALTLTVQQKKQADSEEPQ